MKLSKFGNFVVIALVLTTAAVGCRKRPGDTRAIPPGQTLNPTNAEAANAIPLTDTNNLNGKEGIPLPSSDLYSNYVAHPEILQADTIYFDFDSSVVKSSEKSKVTAVADYMKANPTHAVRVEGHCDERGTEEYNRALGERRALAAREDLVAQGANPVRVVTETFGKDRPVDPGHDEAAWKKNRRAEFIVLVPPAPNP